MTFCRVVCNKIFIMKIIRVKAVKINAANDAAYRSFTKQPSNSHKSIANWHCGKIKQDRLIRVMTKKLHFIYKSERLIEDIKSKAYNIINAANKLSSKNKESFSRLC